MKSEIKTTKNINDNNCKILNLDPLVKTYDDFITQKECEHFIMISKNKLKRALVSDDKKGYESKGRTGFNTWIQHDYDKITLDVGNKIATVVGLPLENAEKFQIIYYDVGQEYRVHYDSWKRDYSPKTLRCVKYGGARLITALCYLNTVEEGGGTKMSKLNITINSKMGKLLIFQNTMIDTDNLVERHPLSEHAGLPVIKGYKYAFNLWFKECNSKRYYHEFNPRYYSIRDNILSDEIKCNFLDELVLLLPDVFEKIANKKDIFFSEKWLSDLDSNDILSRCNFMNSTRKNAWVKLSDVNEFRIRITKLLNIDKDFFENINVVEYKANDYHRRHYASYDMKSTIGKKYTEKLGQRVITITIALSDNIEFEFPLLKKKKNLKKGDIIIYKNIENKNNQRDKDLIQTIANKEFEAKYLANIYIRERDNNFKNIVNKNINPDENIKMEVSPKKKIVSEDYLETLNTILDDFEKNKIKKGWSGYKSFKINFKGDFDNFKKYVLDYKILKNSYTNKLCIQNIHFKKKYEINDYLPMIVIENVIEKEVLQLLNNYYKDAIHKKIFVLGDRQAKRFKAHNEGFSRFLHYELLPLMEHILKKKLRPTYTYLSCYVKGADLPAHTDRKDCEYTVSFLLDKPENATWKIYVHKKRQEIKYKGRHIEGASKDECHELDCNPGGMMMFQGIDHIHFREKLEFDFYNILLLHYRSEE